MTSTMDVDDRSDSDDDEEIVERGAFNALVVVCATKILYTLFLFLSGLRSQREREKGGDRNKYFFLFVFNDKERIQRRETRRSTVSALVPSRFLSNRARRERLCVVVKASIDGGRWTLWICVFFLPSVVVVLCVFVRSSFERRCTRARRMKQQHSA